MTNEAPASSGVADPHSTSRQKRSHRRHGLTTTVLVALAAVGGTFGGAWLQQRRDADSATLPDWFPAKVTDGDLDVAVTEWMNRCSVKSGNDHCGCTLGYMFDDMTRGEAEAKCNEPPKPEPVPVDNEAARRSELVARALAERPEFLGLNGQKAYDDWVGVDGLALTYHDLEKAVWRHVGQRVRFKGKAFHVKEYENYAVFQIDACSGWSHCNLMIHYPKKDPSAEISARENDQLWVYGYVLDEYSFESVAGHKLTVPRVVAVGVTWYR